MNSLTSRQLPRRTFLADLGMGFTGLALGALLNHDGIARALDAFAWMMPGEARSFPVDQLDAAKTWVAATD